MLQINKSVFVTSVAKENNILIDDKVQIAFVGRSNVGKSSLINMLCSNKKLAKTSSTPGRTRLINYFLINESFYFVDLPGYGFAKASKSEAAGWQSLIEPYIIKNHQLKCLCLLVDIRHDLTKLDVQMINFLNFYAVPFIIIATKSDKLPKTKIKPTIVKLSSQIGVGASNIFAVSSENGYGKDAVLQKIEQFL